MTAAEPTIAATSILADLDAGRRRAAVPDPSVPGGWRADPEVKAAILACFRDRQTVTWDLGDVLRFRDRVGLPVKSLLEGPQAEAAGAAGRPGGGGRAPRAARGGSCRAGRASGPGSTSGRAWSSCPPRS